MRDKNMNMGGDIAKEVVPIIDNVVNSFENTPIVDTNTAYSRFMVKLRKRRRRKRLILIAAWLGILLMGTVAGVANKGWRINRTAESNTIQFGTSIDWQAVEDSKKSYNSMDDMLQDLKLPLPLFAEFPEELTPAYIDVDNAENIIDVNISYLDKDGKEKFQVTYKYYKTEREVIGQSIVNDIYPSKISFDIWGYAATVYSDSVMRIATWNYGNFNLTIRTNYEIAEVKQIFEKIKIYEVN